MYYVFLFSVRIQSSITNSPECLALFYDELANVCSAGGDDRANGLLLDIPFVIWLCELMTYYFQNSFVAEHQPVPIQYVYNIEIIILNFYNFPFFLQRYFFVLYEMYKFSRGCKYGGK